MFTKNIGASLAYIKSFVYKSIYILKDNLINSYHELKLSKKKLKKFYWTNISLGLYHLRKNNTKDAILRFNILLFFLHNIKNRKAISRIKDFIAWSYILDGKVSKALNILKTIPPEQQNILFSHLQSTNSNSIPIRLREIFFHLTSLSLEKKIYHEASEIFAEQIDNLIGKKLLILGETRESIKNYLNFAEQELLGNRIVISKYLQNTIKSPDLILQDKIFEAIISFRNLSFNLDLKSTLENISSFLCDQGHLAIVIKYSEETQLDDKSRMFFTFSEKDIEQAAQGAKLEIKEKKFLMLNRSNQYIILVLYKQKQIIC